MSAFAPVARNHCTEPVVSAIIDFVVPWSRMNNAGGMGSIAGFAVPLLQN